MKVKQFIFTLLFVFITLLHYAQGNWEAIPCLSTPNRTIKALLYDSLSNQLIVSFERDDFICNTKFKGILGYNGSNFYDLDFGIETHDDLNKYPSGLGTLACIPYKGKTLIGGLFSSAGTNTVQSEAMVYWNGTNYEAFTKPPFKYNANHLTLPNVVYGFLKDDNKLWIYGQFDTIDGKPAQNLAYFDGNNYTVVNIPVNDNYIVTSAIKYKDEIYFAGGFNNNPFDSIYYIVKYKNGIWSPVGNGIRTSLGGVRSMAIYKDTLYIGGEFAKADGNAGNHLVKWDGKKFYDAGFGNFYDWGGVGGLIVHKDRLYAFGRYTYAANQKAYGASYYQNGKWTVNKDSFNNVIGTAALYKNEIYIGGPFTSINGDASIQRMAKLKCPDFDGCSTTIETTTEPILPQLITANGDNINDEIIIQLPNTKNATLQVFNRWGNMVYKIKDANPNTNTPQILKWDGTYNSKPLPSGTYFYVVESINLKNEQKNYRQFLELVR